MEAVINDILHDPDFNVLGVSVERPRVPRVGDDGATYWQEVGVCRVVIEGAVTPDEVAIRFEGESGEDDGGDGDESWLMDAHMLPLVEYHERDDKPGGVG